MAIYHCSVKTVSRSKGQNAIAAGAYRAGEMLVCEQTGEVFDYRRKSGVIHREVVLPVGFAKINRNELWNLAESSEVRKNSTVAREYELALPHELDQLSRLGLVRQFADHLTKTYGVAVDVAIHAPGRYGDGRNHHAHLLTTTRVITPSGLGAKTRVLDDRKTGEIERIRERWASLVNNALNLTGHEPRVSHKSLETQGSDRHPTIHLGPAAAAMERRGEPSERGDINRTVLHHNFHLDQAKQIEARLQGLRIGLGDLPGNTPKHGRQGGLSGLIKKGLRKISQIWPGRGESQPEPGKVAESLGPAIPGESVEHEADLPETRRPTPVEHPVDPLTQAERLAARLESLAEKARYSQSGWDKRLKEMEACAMAGQDSAARSLLEQVRIQVDKRFPMLEAAKMQEFVSAQTKKFHDSEPPPSDESALGRAAAIDQTARRGRYSLLVMRDIWSGKINKAGQLLQQEEKISVWAKKVAQASGGNYEESRALLVRLEQVGQDLSLLLKSGIHKSSTESASALLLEVDQSLPQAIEKLQQRTESQGSPVQKLTALAADRGRLSEAAHQATEFTAQACEAVEKAAQALHDLSKRSQPIRSMLARLEEQREKKPEKATLRHRPRGMGR